MSRITSCYTKTFFLVFLGVSQVNATCRLVVSVNSTVPFASKECPNDSRFLNHRELGGYGTVSCNSFDNIAIAQYLTTADGDAPNTAEPSVCLYRCTKGLIKGPVARDYNTLPFCYDDTVPDDLPNSTPPPDGEPYPEPFTPLPSITLKAGNWTYQQLWDYCSSLPDSLKCCFDTYGSGTSPCSGWNPNAEYTISQGSCRGADACLGMLQDSTAKVFIGEGSCLGVSPCERLGISAKVSVSVDNGSCLFNYACYGLGQTAASVTIGKNSCTRPQSCVFDIYNSLTDIDIDGDSCTANFACYAMKGTSISIGKNACTTEWSCNQCGLYGNKLTIDNNSTRCPSIPLLDATTVTLQAGNWTYQQLYDICISWPGNDRCCIGPYVSFNYPITDYCGGWDPNKEYSISRGSCKGVRACNGMLGSASKNSKVFIGEGACVGEKACYEVGARANASVSVAEASCLGNNACMGFGSESTFASIKKNSCIADWACHLYAKTSLDIGESSCIGRDSCRMIDAVSFRIGNNACTVADSCKFCGQRTSPLVITENTATCPKGVILSNATSITLKAGSWTYQQLRDFCKSFAESERCCSAGWKYDDERNYCAGWNPNVEYVISKGSCRGHDACNDMLAKAKSNSKVVIDEGACVGVESCEGLGEFTDNTLVYVGKRSCVNDNACEGLGSLTTTFASIDGGSCVGRSSCLKLGANALSLTIGENACTGLYACYEEYNEYNDAIIVDIQENACSGDSACYAVKGEIILIGVDACNSPFSCQNCGMDDHYLIVDDYSSECLTFPIPVAPVQDNVTLG